MKHLLGRAGLTSAMLTFFVLTSSALAQDSSQSSGSQTPATQDNSQKPDNAGGAPASPIGLAWADSYIHQIGTSGLLGGSREGIGWGSLYIPTASATGITERFEATSTLPATTLSAAILQTAVIYDHRLGTSRVAIQYSPSMAIEGGKVVGSFSNQNTSLDLLLYERPRWNVRFHDSFSYYYTQQAFGYDFFDVNPVSGGSVTNNFLSGPVRWLSDSAYFSVAYALSRRTSITVAPSFVYSESGVTATTHAVSYGGSVNLNYRTSERQTVGIEYSSQLIHERFPTPTGSTTGPSTDTLYETLAGTAARQLSATWLIRGSAGVTTSSYTLTTTTTNQRLWQAYGSFGLIKQLGRSAIGLNYSRGDTLSNGLISSVYADRVDATFRNQAGRRFSWLIGGGYLRQVGSSAFSGWYAISDAQFLLAPRAGLFSFFDFTHNNQGTNAANLYVGNRDYFSYGIRWQPGKIAH